MRDSAAPSATIEGMVFPHLLAQVPFVEQGLLLMMGLLWLPPTAAGVIWLWVTVAGRWFNRKNSIGMTAYWCAVIGVWIYFREAIPIMADFFWDTMSSVVDSLLKKLW